jgi:hypothetical protein
LRVLSEGDAVARAHRATSMRRRAAACVAVLGALFVVAACRQLVGITDRGVAAGVEGDAGGCGLVFPEGACRTCMEAKCCSAAATCAGEPACATNEECVAACDGGENCVERCQLSDPAGTVAGVPALDTCLATSCADQCGIPCGAHTGLVASPDASVPCATCIAANACSAAEACGTSLACETLYRCEVACSTLDCATTCEFDDAGTQLFNAYGALLQSSCAVDCQLGQNWVCVGHISWPLPKATSLAISAVVADAFVGTPTAGADVKLCELNDQGCQKPIDDQMTDANGAVTLHYALTNTTQGGLDGYLLTTSSAIAPSLFFWGFPLSEPVASFGIKISTVAASELGPLLATLGAPSIPGRGLVFVGALDCSHNPAVGAHVNILSGGDSKTQTFYGVAGGDTFSTTTDGTDGSGVALLVNLPAGPVKIQVLNAAGTLVSEESFLVVDGGAEEVVALPTPM